MSHIHTNEIIHRDLKLENVLLVNKSEDSDIKIIDFDLSKTVEDLKNKTDFCGTSWYLAPEII